MKKLLFISCLLLQGQLFSQSEESADGYILNADELKKNMKPDSALIYYEKAAVEYGSLKKIEKFVNANNQIATILTRQDKYDKAKAFLEINFTTGLDTTDLLIATSYITLGVIANAEEKYGQSLIYHYKALNIRLQKLGEYHSDVATSYGNIGNVKLNNIDLNGSIEAHLKAMQIREKLFEKEGVEVIQSYTNLGNVYKEKKDYKTALEYYEKALKSKILQRGEKHKELVKFYKNMSDVYFLLENKEKGELYKTKAEESSKS